MSEARLIEGKTADGASWKIHYTVQGSGEDLILLHGGGPGASGATNYARNVDALSKHFKTWVFDFPGFGQSSKNLNAFGSPLPFTNAGRTIKCFMTRHSWATWCTTLR